MDIKEHISKVKSVLAEEKLYAETVRAESNKKLSKIDRVVSDYLHILELTELSYHQYARVGKQLASILKSRRPVKDDLRMAEQLIRIESCVSKVQSIEDGISALENEERTYKIKEVCHGIIGTDGSITDKDFRI